MDEQISEEPVSFTQAELGRMWQHGLHEERLFHDRLDYFSVVELGLLSAFAILYNKDRPFGLLIPLSVAGMAFTLFWLVLQHNHWRYCLYLNLRLREYMPEFRKTGDTYFAQFKRSKHATAFTFSKHLSFGAPLLFALTWIAFLVWVIAASLAETS